MLSIISCSTCIDLSYIKSDSKRRFVLTQYTCSRRLMTMLSSNRPVVNRFGRKSDFHHKYVCHLDSKWRVFICTYVLCVQYVLKDQRYLFYSPVIFQWIGTQNFIFQTQNSWFNQETGKIRLFAMLFIYSNNANAMKQRN